MTDEQKKKAEEEKWVPPPIDVKVIDWGEPEYIKSKYPNLKDNHMGGFGGFFRI